MLFFTTAWFSAGEYGRVEVQLHHAPGAVGVEMPRAQSIRTPEIEYDTASNCTRTFWIKPPGRRRYF
jgi:hypothetical protein